MSDRDMFLIAAAAVVVLLCYMSWQIAEVFSLITTVRTDMATRFEAIETSLSSIAALERVAERYDDEHSPKDDETTAETA